MTKPTAAAIESNHGITVEIKHPHDYSTLSFSGVIYTDSDAIVAGQLAALVLKAFQEALDVT